MNPLPTSSRLRRARPVVPVVLAAVVLTVTACGSSGDSATTRAQTYAKHANLTANDLPSGWRLTGSSSTLSTTTSTLAPDRAATVRSVLDGLPATCRPFRNTFMISLVNGPPSGALAQNVSAFGSSADGSATIDSTAVVFGSPQEAQATYGAYASPAFSPCLQGFLLGTLSKVAGLSGVTVTVTPTPTTSAEGVESTGFSVVQSATSSGAKASKDTTDERILRSGAAMAFLGAQSSAATIPPAAVTAFDHAVATTAGRLVPPPA